MGVLKKFLIMCSGASHEILSKPEFAAESSKYAGIGAAVFLTGLFSFLSASFAVNQVFRSSLLSLLIGLLWGVVVFNLDRFIVLTLRRKRVPPDLPIAERVKRRGAEVSVLLPRLILAVFISLTISTPLELRIFEREIDAYLERRALSEIAGIKQRLLEQNLNINRLKVENDGLTKDIEIKEKEVNDLRQSLLDRMRASSYKQIYGQLRRSLIKSEDELAELRLVNGEKIRANSQELDELNSKVEAQASLEQAAVARGDGLLARLAAFSELKSDSRTIATASVFLTLLFVLLFTAPVLMKLFSNIGPYEQFWETLEAMAHSSKPREEDPGSDDEVVGVRLQKEASGRAGAKVKGQGKGRGGEAQNGRRDSRRRLRAFLCHSSQDKLAIRKLYKRLLSDAVDPWLDEENILPGQDWNQEIIKAVKASDVVIACLSSGLSTKAGFVHKEIQFALEVATEQPAGAIFLIPVKLEECEVPDALQRLQWVNLFEEDGYGRLKLSLEKRARSIGVAVGGDI